MDDADWDLHAVVRGCAAAASASSSTTAPVEAPFPSADQISPDLIDKRRNPLPSPAPAPPPAQTLHRLPHPIQMQFTNSVNFPATVDDPPPVRQRRRKNQMKIVCRTTEDKLSDDSWSWRKYGQKPIKGSPYPSTLKGCNARKQVERSPDDPTIFLVSYAGEHAHPMPARRSTLSGSTRGRISGDGSTAVMNDNSNSVSGGASTTASGSSVSPPAEEAPENDVVEEDD